MKKILFLFLIVFLLAGCASFRNVNPQEPPAPKITEMVICSFPPAGHRQYRELEQPILPGSDFWVYFEFKNLSEQEVDGIESVWLIVELQIKDLVGGEEYINERCNYTIETSNELIRKEYFWLGIWAGTIDTTYEFTLVLKDGFTGKQGFYTTEIVVSSKREC